MLGLVWDRAIDCTMHALMHSRPVRLCDEVVNQLTLRLDFSLVAR